MFKRLFYSALNAHKLALGNVAAFENRPIAPHIRAFAQIEVVLPICSSSRFQYNAKDIFSNIFHSLVAVTKQMRGQGMLQWSVLNDGGSCAEF